MFKLSYVQVIYVVIDALLNFLSCLIHCSLILFSYVLFSTYTNRWLNTLLASYLANKICLYAAMRDI